LSTHLSRIYVRAQAIDVRVIGNQSVVTDPSSLSDRHAVISRSNDVYSTTVLAGDAQAKWLERVSAASRKPKRRENYDLSLCKVVAPSIDLRVNMSQLETAIAISRNFA
jgi:hypothetical protein